MQHREDAPTSTTMAHAHDAGGKLIREWWWLGWSQELPVHSDQWQRYPPTVEYHLSTAYDALRLEGRCQGLVLDLEPVTEGKQPYQVWMAQPVMVENKNEPALLGKLAIAGYTKDLWQLPKEQFPATVRGGGDVRIGFYQIYKEHVEQLNVLNDYLTDSRSLPCAITSPIRRRVVIRIEMERPAFIHQDVNRFRKKKDPLPPAEAVFQWWCDDTSGGVGHWEKYPPDVCLQLERELTTNEGFKNCEVPVPIYTDTYSVKRLSRERPVVLVEQSKAQGVRENILPRRLLTLDCEHFDDMDRATDNCFVQFRNGEPKRRRPVRRVRLPAQEDVDDANRNILVHPQ